MKIAVLMSIAVAFQYAAPVIADESSSFVAAARDAAGDWSVQADASLRGSLEGWSELAGWTVIWDSATDYRIRVPATFAGSFENAVSELISAVHQTNPELSVTLYRGNKVVHAVNAVASR